jgi:23S rRNA (uracil1939-C5)-methyltransferase
MGYRALDCPVNQRCGGCQLLNVPYPLQLKRKQQQMAELFADSSVVVKPIKGMDSPLHYRNKVITPFAPGPKGRILTGMYAQGTHRLIPTDDCLIENEVSQALLKTLRELMPKCRITPYQEDTGKGFLRHAQVRSSYNTDEIMLTLVTNDRAFPGKKHFVETMRKHHPEITTIVQNVNTRRTNVILGEHETTLYGPGFIIDELCGCRFRISSRSFFQVNPSQAEKLYTAALEMTQLTGKETLLDAYCGIGTIGLIAAPRVTRVIGVEENSEAVRDAKANARHNHIENAEFFTADAGMFLREAGATTHVDVLMMDPPRSGADERFLKSAVALSPTKICYISCNPETQKRDVTILAEHGYRITGIQPVDMFPHTSHVESIVLMTKYVSADEK